MAKYKPAINIWELSDSERAKLQVGQHIYAGDKSNKGVFLGMGRGGTCIAAWHGNACGHPLGYRGYINLLMDYVYSQRGGV